MIRNVTYLCSILCLFLFSCKETTIIEAGNGLTDPGLMPAVIYSFPAANSAGPYDGFSTSITVRFNKLMELSSLRHAVHFGSSVGDILPDTCTVNINQGDLALISPIRANLTIPFLWRVGRSYSLRIDPTARDINGNRLGSAFEMSFTPEPVFRIMRISPLAGVKNTSTTSFQMSFNAPVEQAIQSHITISPAVSGLWRYLRFSSTEYDSSQIIFQSSSGFAVGTTYAVSIDAGAVDKNGDPLAGGYASTFSSAPFSVTSSSPSDGSLNWPGWNRRMQFTFNDTLDVATVPGAFAISPPVGGAFTFENGVRSFAFTASEDLLPETIYSISIDTSIRSLGRASMPHPYTINFLTSSADGGGSTFFVTSAYPYEGDTTVFSTTPVEIWFSALLDTASARAAFTMSPPVSGLLSFPDANNLRFSPIETFPLSTTITVMLASSLHSKGGIALRAPYTLSFRTRPLTASMNYPPDGATHIATSVGSIIIGMNDPIDTSSVSGAVSISPAVGGSIVTSQDGYYIYLTPDAPLQPHTVYAVTVSTALRTRSGAQLPAPATFYFATGP